MPEMPVPTSVSAEAAAVLKMTANVPSQPDPLPNDDPGWQLLGKIAATSEPGTIEALAMATTGAVPSTVPVDVAQAEVGQATYYIATPEGVSEDDQRVLFYIHGGGFTFGGGAQARRSTELLAGNFGVRTWGMDYRQLPDAPFPAGLDDCIAVYRHLLETHAPGTVVVAGQSGGANLSAALMLRARDEGLPFPAAVGLLSPPVDLTESGDTYQTNRFSMAGSTSNMFARYVGQHDFTDPYVSPLFGGYDDTFPPYILTAGTRDFLLSDTVRLHRTLLKAGVRAELHVWEGGPHGLFMGRAPEDKEQIEQLRSFFEAAWDARNVS